ncbi:MAG: glycosyltransferase family 2 protein [Thermoprotei archaeon]|jgi:glycosyltransferase involved in cell wall biosynthesis
MDKLIDTFTSKIGNAEVAVLMPVYNEADVIEDVVNEYYNVIGDKVSVEIVLSEDGSTDGTKDIIERLSEKIPLKALLSPERKGYARGIIDGLNYVSSEYVLITDSDGQHDPRDFFKLWKLRRDADIISGWRRNRIDALHRKIISRTFQFLAKHLFNLPDLKDITAPFKLMKTDTARIIANECKYMKESFWTEFTIRAFKKNLKIKEVIVKHRPRSVGSTRVYKPLKIPEIAIKQFYALVKLRWEII